MCDDWSGCNDSAKFRKDFKGIESWDVSKVKNMGAMFREAFSFNQPLNKWNVANVEDIGSMFAFALSFNQNLQSWNLKSLKFAPINILQWAFYKALSFNQNIKSWNLWQQNLSTLEPKNKLALFTHTKVLSK